MVGEEEVAQINDFNGLRPGAGMKDHLKAKGYFEPSPYCRLWRDTAGKKEALLCSMPGDLERFS
jgi:hypothetical protein